MSGMRWRGNGICKVEDWLIWFIESIVPGAGAVADDEIGEAIGGAAGSIAGSIISDKFINKD